MALRVFILYIYIYIYISVFFLGGGVLKDVVSGLLLVAAASFPQLFGTLEFEVWHARLGPLSPKP